MRISDWSSDVCSSDLVDEDILSAILADDEAETLLLVEELDRSLAGADYGARHAATATAPKRPRRVWRASRRWRAQGPCWKPSWTLWAARLKTPSARWWLLLAAPRFRQSCLFCNCWRTRSTNWWWAAALPTPLCWLDRNSVV